MNNEPKASMNLDPELLAAYIDQRLSPEQRAAVEAELARDPDAYSVLVESLKALEEMPEQKTMPGQSGTARTQRWRVAAGLLAAAAAIVLVVRLQPELLLRIRGERADPRLGPLVAAVGDQRTVEARLTGGFKYAPLQSVTRGPTGSSTQNLALLAAAGSLQQSATASSSSRDLHYWGLAQVLLGDYDNAVRSLREAAIQAPEDARIHSDLSTSLLARARSAGRAEDLAPALASADQALELDPGLIEARFNRALALENLHLDEQAIDAWKAYLAVDPSSEWSAEARRHLRSLEDKPAGSAWSPGGALTNANAFRARDWLFTNALPAWGNGVLAKAEVQPARDQIISVTDRLAQLTHDRVFEVVSADVSGAADVNRDMVAAGYSEFGLAIAAVRSDQLRQIGQHSRSACRSFTAAGSAFAPACEVERAAALFQERDFKGLRLELARLGPIVSSREFRYAEARVRGFEGMLLILDGRLADSATPARDARNIFESIAEWPSAARMWNFEADSLYWSGRYRDSWSSRMGALDLAAKVRDPHVSYSVLSSVGAVLLNDQLPGPAGTFSAAATRPWSVELPPLMKLFPLQRALMAAVEAGHLQPAQAARDQLEQIVKTSVDPRLSAMTGDVKLAFASLEVAQGRPELAEVTLTEALKGLGPERQLSTRLWGQLARAQIFLDRGDSSRAAVDLKDVIDRLAVRTGAAVNVRVADIGKLRRTAARLALTSGGTDWEVVRLYDRARLVLDSGVIPDLDGRDETLRAIPPDTALVAFVDDAERIGAWVLSAKDYGFYSLPTDSAEIRRLASHLAFLAEHSGAGSEKWVGDLQSLHNLLLTPLQNSIDGVTRLVFITDGVTRAVPIAALLDPNQRPAFVRWTIANAPSIAAALESSSHKPTIGKVLVVSDPTAPGTVPLPGARREAEAISAVYGARTALTRLVGGEATRLNVESALTGASVIHFAIHAVADSINPGLAYFQLASDATHPDGRWLVETLRRDTFARNQTVVLAACRSAEGSPDPQESVTSLAAAVIRAGAGEVVATLWPLPDSESARLFAVIHQHLHSGLSAADAVRIAQQQFSKAGKGAEAVAAVSGLQVFRIGLTRERSHSGS